MPETEDITGSNIIIPLKYELKENYDNIQNILLIKDDVHQKNKLYQAHNINTLPIYYNSASTKLELKELISKIKNLKRIAIAFHDAYLNQNETFLDNQPLFTQGDLSQSDKELYSENLQFFIQLKHFNITNLDFLVCNSLQYQKYIQFYQIVQNETGITVGASNDKTGNLKYGGDWELENTLENIKNIYFNSNIDNYSSTLDTTTISTNTNISQSDIESYTFPVTINGGTQENPINIKFTGNLNLQASQFFIIQSPYINFDGQNNTVNFIPNDGENTSNTNGLIQNGIIIFSESEGPVFISGYSNINIKNIGITNNQNVNLNQFQGWLCHFSFGLGIEDGNILIDNCYATGAITGSQLGGITGAGLGVAMSNGSITIQNCYSTGDITDEDAGGIAGANLGAEMTGGSITIQNCYTTGEITGNNAGGITGAGLGVAMSNGSITIQNNMYNNNGGKPLIGSIADDNYLTTTNNNTQPDNTWSDDNAFKTIFSENTWGTTYSKNIINTNRWFLLSNIENNIVLLFIIGKDENNNLIFIPINPDEPTNNNLLKISLILLLLIFVTYRLIKFLNNKRN